MIHGQTETVDVCPGSSVSQDDIRDAQETGDADEEGNQLAGARAGERQDVLHVVQVEGKLYADH
jgi:hypothetical protein